MLVPGPLAERLAGGHLEEHRLEVATQGGQRGEVDAGLGQHPGDGGGLDGVDVDRVLVDPASEEVGAIPTPVEVLGEYVFRPAVDWAYTTLVVRVPERFGNSINFETDDVDWFRPDDVDTLPLHAGFAG